MRGCPGPHTNRTYDVSTSLWREVVYERLRLETGLSHRYTDDCAACTGNGQRTRAIQNEATKKAIRRAISTGWRRSGVRTSLHPNSLLTGNFTGRFAISMRRERLLKPEAS